MTKEIIITRSEIQKSPELQVEEWIGKEFEDFKNNLTNNQADHEQDLEDIRRRLPSVSSRTLSIVINT